jgi:hypothetical protein
MMMSLSYILMATLPRYAQIWITVVTICYILKGLSSMPVIAFIVVASAIGAVTALVTTHFGFD